MSKMIAIAALLTGCGGDKDSIPPSNGNDPAEVEGPGNVLILLIDDVGVDKFAPYGAYDMQPSTPNLDSLTERGVLFRNAYASPICSPTRAALLTGRYTSRTGIGRTVWETSSLELENTQTLLPEMLAASPWDYATAAVGKWHLAGMHSPSALLHPTLNGFDSYQGTIGNIGNYYNWMLNDNGTEVESFAYTTTHQIDAAIDLVETLPEPWLLYVAFNAPHKPLHVPPLELHSYPDLTDTAGDPQLFNAVVEAVDTEVGRLLFHIEGGLMDRTTVMFIGDNGTGNFAITPPFDTQRAKDSLFEGGIHVPFVVAGPQVAAPGTESDAFVHVADVFHTVAEIAEVDLSTTELANVETDGISLLPYLADPSMPSLREYAFSEEFAPLGAGPYTIRSRTVRDARFKMIRNDGSDQPYRQELFEFLPGAIDEGPVIEAPFEADQQDAWDRLSAELDRLDAELVFDPRL